MYRLPFTVEEYRTTSVRAFPLGAVLCVLSGRSLLHYYGTTVVVVARLVLPVVLRYGSIVTHKVEVVRTVMT